MAKIVIRSSVAQDRPYLIDSFVRSYRSNSAYAQGVHGELLVGLVEPLLALWNVAVAADIEDDTILGWICWRDAKTVAWIKVKEGVNGKGIARALLRHAGVQCPSEIACPFLPTAHQFAREAERRGYTLRFRPYLALQAAREAAGVA
jgi:GNAT superfamily N-acetyltransferase